MLGLRCTPVYPRLATDLAALPLRYGAVVGTGAVQDAATHGKGSGHAPAVVAGALLAACSRARVVGWAVSVGREGGGSGPPPALPVSRGGGRLVGACRHFPLYCTVLALLLHRR